MAQSFLISRAVLDGLAQDIGASLGRFTALAADSRIEIGEAFEVWAVGVVSAPRPLAEVAVRTGRYHLQVYIGPGGGAAEPAAAVSLAEVEGEGLRVAKVSDASLAQPVHDAIRDVDGSDRALGDVTARLLMAWPYRIYAFWFPAPGKDSIYVISALNGLERIRPRQWMDSTEFVSHLAAEPYVRGVEDDRPAAGA